MRSARWVLGSAPVLVAALVAASAAAGSVKISAGQEFLYAGTASWKYGVSEQPIPPVKGVVKASALVTEVDPEKGYTVILMRSFQPEAQAGAPPFPPEAQVATLQYDTDRKPDPFAQAGFLSGPIGMLVGKLNLPFAPETQISVGRKWRVTEAPLLMLPHPLDMTYHVVERTTVAGRPCLKVEKRVTQPLPVKVELRGQDVELTDFRQTFCVDPATGQVLSHELHASQRQAMMKGHLVQEIHLSLVLQDVRKLAPAALESRVNQAKALDAIQSTLFAFRPDFDLKKAQAEATKKIHSFRQDFPNSPYSFAVDRIELSMPGRPNAKAPQNTAAQR